MEKNNLKELRVSKGMSREELVARTGLSFCSIRYYEEHRVDLSRAELTTIIALCKALNCKVVDLFQNQPFIDECKRLSRKSRKRV